MGWGDFIFIFVICLAIITGLPLIIQFCLLAYYSIRLRHKKRQLNKQIRKCYNMSPKEFEREFQREQYFRMIEQISGKTIDVERPLNIRQTKEKVYQISPEFACVTQHELSEQELKVIKMFFGFESREKSLDEIGIKLNLTKERVRQIKNNAIFKLRKNPKIEILKVYFN